MASRQVVTASFTGCSYFCSRLSSTRGGGLGQVRQQVRQPILASASMTTAAGAGAGTPANNRVIKIVGIAGTLRKAATNRGLINAAQSMVEKDFPDMSFEVAPIGNLPLFNEDLEIDGLYPQAVAQFRQTVHSADAILIATPEYNYSVSGVLKNAIDWGSRSPNVFEGKPAAIMGAGGYMGTARAQYHLRQIAVFLDLKLLNKPEVFINRFSKPSPFNDQGDLVGADVEKKVHSLLVALRAQTIFHLAQKTLLETP